MGFADDLHALGADRDRSAGHAYDLLAQATAARPRAAAKIRSMLGEAAAFLSGRGISPFAAIELGPSVKSGLLRLPKKHIKVVGYLWDLGGLTSSHYLGTDGRLYGGASKPFVFTPETLSGLNTSQAPSTIVADDVEFGQRVGWAWRGLELISDSADDLLPLAGVHEGKLTWERFPEPPRRPLPKTYLQLGVFSDGEPALVRSGTPDEVQTCYAEVLEDSLKWSVKGLLDVELG